MFNTALGLLQLVRQMAATWDPAQRLLYTSLKIRVSFIGSKSVQILGHTAHIFRNGHVVVIENNNKIPFQTGSIVQRLISHAASQRTISDYGYHMLVTVLQISGCHQTDPCRDRSRAVSRIKTVTVTFLSLGETTHTAIFPKLVKS